jgi:H+-transporting ATPase
MPAHLFSPLPFVEKRVSFYVVIIYSSFFEDKFGVDAIKDANDARLHMIIYLQVAQISQALIFVTRSHSFFFMERPSIALMAAFGLAQLVSSIIAGFGNWGFTSVQPISGGWIGIVWYVPVPYLKRRPSSDEV